MKVIINCDPENIELAYQLLQREVKNNWEKRYIKPGWGWHFYKGGISFFVRGIKNGLSVTQTTKVPF